MVKQESFLKDVEKHEMIILHESGINRHIRFRNPTSGCYFFDIITYKGGLLITGDCGAYAFERIEDMFNFFTHGNKEGDSNLYINDRYWAEKVVAMDKHHNIQKFSKEKFEKEVWEDFFTWVRDNKDTVSKSFRREVYDAIQDEIIDVDDNDEGSARLMAVYEFEKIDYKTKESFRLNDFYERDFMEYSDNYLWNLYAIVWGIKKYRAESGAF
jgi:hypothetical protein